MPLSEKHRQERLARTREPAAALVEDLAHMRDVLSRPEPSRSELRRLSVTLRRLIIYRDISRVAEPRIGRITLQVPNTKPIVAASRDLPLNFFTTSGLSLFGVTIHWVFFFNSALSPSQVASLDMLLSQTATVRIDGFMSQPVLCLQSNWISRADVIKYMANIASGAHSGTPREHAHTILARLRAGVTYSKEGGMSVRPDRLAAPNPPFEYSPDAVDIVLIQVLSAAKLVTDSPDTMRLEEQIRSELSRSA